MSLSEIITFLEELKAEKGDIVIGCDFSQWDREKLVYNEDLNCIFGE